MPSSQELSHPQRIFGISVERLNENQLVSSDVFQQIKSSQDSIELLRNRDLLESPLFEYGAVAEPLYDGTIWYDSTCLIILQHKVAQLLCRPHLETETEESELARELMLVSTKNYRNASMGFWFEPYMEKIDNLLATPINVTEEYEELATANQRQLQQE